MQRLRREQLVLGGGGLALLIFLFALDWFGASVSATAPGGATFTVGAAVNGWHSLLDVRWLLAATIVVACAAVLLSAFERQPRLIDLNMLACALGLLSAALVLYRVFDHPHGSGSVAGGASFRYGARLGLYLALAACLAIAYGGYLAMRQEGHTMPTRDRP